MTRFHQLTIVCMVVAVINGLEPLTVLGQTPDDAADAQRLSELLHIHTGAIVADVGAGPGLLTIHVSRLVSPSGRVYATDINPQRLDELRQVSASHANVIVVQGGSARTNLPTDCCDAIFMRHVYHHVGDPAAMNASLLQSLKPGGRVAVVDFAPNSGDSAPPGRRDTKVSHGVTPKTVREELAAAGFISVAEVAWTSRNLFAVIAERPK
jgi:ubiquinone/menaquinone biosynthesis C-methylase UbiE